MFFNSSLMTADGHKDFDTQCYLVEPCSTEDTTLRVSSEYSPEAIIPWKEPKVPMRQRWIPIFMAICCLGCSVILVLHTLLPRLVAKLRSRSKKTYTEQQRASSELGEDTFQQPNSRDSTGSHIDQSPRKHRRGSVPLSYSSNSGAFKIPPRSEKRISESPSLRMTDEKLAFWQQAGSARKFETPWCTSPTVAGSPYDSYGQPYSNDGNFHEAS